MSDERHWDKGFAGCSVCETTDQKHAAAGLCWGCYYRRRRARAAFGRIDNKENP